MPNRELSSLPTHETPVSQSEEPGERIEWDVAAWALWVMVWAAHAGTGGLEAAAGDQAGRCRGFED